MLLVYVLIAAASYLTFKIIQWTNFEKKFEQKTSSFPQLQPHHWFNKNYSYHKRCMFDHPEHYVAQRLAYAKQHPLGYVEEMHPITKMSPWINVFDPVAVKAILTARYTSAPKYQRVMEPLMIGFKPYSIFFCNGDMWKNHRHVLNAQFNQQLLKSYMPIVNSCVRTMTEKWQGYVENSESSKNSKNSKNSQNNISGTVNIHKDFMLLTLDVLLQTLMSYESNCQISDDDRFVYSVQEWLKSWHLRMDSPFGLSDILFYYVSPSGRKCVAAAKFMYDCAFERVHARQKLYKVDPDYQNSKERLDIIDILVAGTKENGEPFSYDEIIMETIIFMVAGFETTANTLSWCLHHLASNQECLGKLQAEVDGFTNEEITHDKLNELPYIDAVLKETLRHSPIGQRIFSRVLDRDIKLSDGRVLPSDVPIHINILELHRNEERWPDPDKFDPSRFLKCENGKTIENHPKIDPFSYIPFSAGARNCIGRHFAMQEMKVSLVYILKQFEILPDETPSIPTIRITYRPLDGIYVKLRLRE